MGVDTPDAAGTPLPQTEFREVRDYYLLLIAYNNMMDCALAVYNKADLSLYLV